MYIGEIAALATALCWSIAVFVFRKLSDRFDPINLNFWKGLLASVALVPVVFLNPEAHLPDTNSTLWLLLSGAIGIGVGDSAFFAALYRLREQKTLLLTETLAPIITALLAMFWISEWLSALQWSAIAVVIFGVDWVIRTRRRQRTKPASNTAKTLPLAGIFYAGLAALSQALGAVISRQVLTESSTDPISASWVRLLGGLILIVPFILFSRFRFVPNRATETATWAYLALATLFGTFLAMILQMVAFADAPAAIVQSLFASSIIMSLVISAFYGEKISAKTTFGSIIAVIGVVGIFLAK